MGKMVHMRTGWDSWIFWVANKNRDTGYDGLLVVTSKVDHGRSFESPEDREVGIFPEV